MKISNTLLISVQYADDEAYSEYDNTWAIWNALCLDTLYYKIDNYNLFKHSCVPYLLNLAYSHTMHTKQILLNRTKNKYLTRTALQCLQKLL